MMAEDYAPAGYRLLVQITELLSEENARAYVERAFRRRDAVLKQGHVDEMGFCTRGWMAFVPGPKSQAWRRANLGRKGKR